MSVREGGAAAGYGDLTVCGTQFPNVISWTPMLDATSRMERPPSTTNCTAWSRYSCVTRRRVDP